MKSFFSVVALAAIVGCANVSEDQLAGNSASNPEITGYTQEIAIQNPDGTVTKDYLINVYPTLEAAHNPLPYIKTALIEGTWLGYSSLAIVDGHPNDGRYSALGDSPKCKVRQLDGEFDGCQPPKGSCFCDDQAIVVHPVN